MEIGFYLEFESYLGTLLGNKKGGAIFKEL